MQVQYIFTESRPKSNIKVVKPRSRQYNRNELSKHGYFIFDRQVIVCKFKLQF